MRRTLLIIPHEILGIPVFGLGWLLMAVLVLLAIRLLVVRQRGKSVRELIRHEGLMWGAFLFAIWWVLPRVEVTNVDGEPIGMAIRGYGVMLLLGVASAVGLAAYRAKQRGIDPDIIYSMAPWAFIGGILGARIFFVIQYRDQFIGDSIAESIGNMLKFTEGGLVVYGSFIGGFIAVTFYILRHGLSWLRFGDVIVPCLFIGLAFGRIGCLMNGCCYGGRCEDSRFALHFPATSPVYDDQIRSGELLGFRYDASTRVIESVREGSLAERAGIRVGARLDALADDRTSLETAPRSIPKEDAVTGVIATIDGKRYRWGPDELPTRALPVYPTQLISSVSGLLLCLGLCSLPTRRMRDGTVMMLGFAGYAIIRFVLELIRVDEAGQFGTSLSISQWVSLVVLACSLIGLAWLYWSPRSAAVQTQPSSGS